MFFTIARQTSLLTDPYFFIIFFGILRILILDIFEYVINPRVNTFEDPLIEVIVLESSPPVQDSTIEIFNLFLINFFTTKSDFDFILSSTQKEK